MKPEWQCINVINSADKNHNALIFKVSHSMGDGLRISQFFNKWCKFANGSDAYIDVFRKMMDRGTKIAKSNIPIFKIICNFIVNCFDTILEGSSKVDDKLC